MSWIELDDGILEHPKFIRAVKIGGDGTVFLWLGLRAYCARNLTDGVVPEDMIDECRGPTDKQKRAKALAALVTVGLLKKTSNGVEMHDYLDWSSSREQVLERRERSRERKARQRGESHVPSRRDTKRDSAETPHGVTNPRARDPLPHLTSTPPTPLPQTDAANSDSDIPCPTDLSLPPDAIGNLEMTAGVPRWAVESITADYVSRYLATPDDKRHRNKWLRGLSTTILARWRDPKQRPVRGKSEAEQAAAVAARVAADAAQIAKAKAKLSSEPVDPETVKSELDQLLGGKK